jgi:hypothetical protein
MTTALAVQWPSGDLGTRLVVQEGDNDGARRVGRAFRDRQCVTSFSSLGDHRGMKRLG